MSSRLIVKNLPKNINEAKIRQLFEEKGIITDIQLKYTKDGVFRQFAFIGYQNENDANKALEHFNNSFIQTSRIKVEHCAALGSETKPKSWSKYANDSSAYRKLHGIDELERAEREKKFLEAKAKAKPKNRKNVIEEIVGDYKNDPEFQEFMQVHDKNRVLWENDYTKEDANENNQKSIVQNKENCIDEERTPDDENKILNKHSSKNIKKSENSLDESDIENEESESGEQEEEQLLDNNEDQSTEQEKVKLALKNEVSDLEYIKALMNKKNADENKLSSENKKTKSNEKAKVKVPIDLLTIKIHNIPFKTKKQDIIKFFKPLKCNSVRLPRSTKGFCYVGFKQEKDFQKAMSKDKSFILGKQVYFSNFTEKNKITKSKKEELNSQTNDKSGKWAKQQDGLQNEEDISESGKIFFRNLAYTITEDDLQNLFEKYGPIAEISLPIDPITRKIKGFGTVTFVMPEHAVQAFNELDGSTFHGRLMHLIPGKSKDGAEQDENTEGLSFKAKKALKIKKSAGQSHNWNILFMGQNAVADILAKTFDTSKETILDTNTGGSSAAVRLALGETQIIMEMKKYLEENGVRLDVFENIPEKRSKTVFLAKNLPAETTVEELRPLFEPFGLLGRIILPPSGVTAIIEFLEPSEAKKAFYKMAYSKFKHLPLYLEWAPENVFKTSLDDESQNSEINNNNQNESNVNKKSNETNNLKEEIKEEECKIAENNKENTEIIKSDLNDVENVDEDEEPEQGTTLFLKNLNFSTREFTVKNHFKHLGTVHLAQVAMRKDPQNPKNVTSLGYGFIQFKKRAVAELALKEMQFTKIEGNTVELKRSDRTLKMDPKTARKKVEKTEQTGSKILVRNIPFQTKTKEVFEIFKAFGELRSVRLPKKLTPGEESLRGFGFVDYISKSDAKKAFDNLSGSTHLYGRRLVLEWAKNDETDVSELRKRTAETYNDVNTKRTKNSRKAVFDSTQMDEKAIKNNDEDMS